MPVLYKFSRSIIDGARSLIDDARMTLQLAASFTITINERHILYDTGPRWDLKKEAMSTTNLVEAKGVMIKKVLSGVGWEGEFPFSDENKSW